MTMTFMKQFKKYLEWLSQNNTLKTLSGHITHFHIHLEQEFQQDLIINLFVSLGTKKAPKHRILIDNRLDPRTHHFIPDFHT